MHHIVTRKDGRRRRRRRRRAQQERRAHRKDEHRVIQPDFENNEVRLGGLCVASSNSIAEDSPNLTFFRSLHSRRWDALFLHGGRTDGRNKSQNNHFILERSAAITDSAVNEAGETDRQSSLRSAARCLKEGTGGKAAMTGQACGGGRTTTDGRTDGRTDPLMGTVL